MKIVFEGEIVNIVANNNSMVIAYVLEKGESKMRISYKMISFDNGEITNVRSADPYDLTKFGPNYKDIITKIKNHIQCKSVILPNGKTFVVDIDGAAYLFDADGALIWQGKIAYQDAPPAGIAINNRYVWVSFKELNVLMRLNLATMHEELRIGGGKTSPFNKPCNLFIEDDDIYICSEGSSDIIKVNTLTYNIETYRSFNKNVQQYLKAGEYEFVVLETGVYLIN